MTECSVGLTIHGQLTLSMTRVLQNGSAAIHISSIRSTARQYVLRNSSTESRWPRRSDSSAETAWMCQRSRQYSRRSAMLRSQTTTSLGMKPSKRPVRHWMRYLVRKNIILQKHKLLSIFLAVKHLSLMAMKMRFT